MALANTMPMPSMAVAAHAPVPIPSFQQAPNVPSQAMAADAPIGILPFEQEAYEGDGIAIGIDLGAANIRVAVWDADQGRAVPISFIQSEFGADLPPEAIPSVVAYPTSSKTFVGQAALSTPTGVPLIGMQRLLGRTYASLGGAKWLAREADEFIGAELVPEDGQDTHGGVRFKMSFERPRPSGLKKRGANPELRTGANGARAKSSTIEQTRAPEEAIYKLIQAAKEIAEAHTEQEVTHCTVIIPAHWGLTQRRGAFDAAMLAGLTPLAILPPAVALVAGGQWTPPRTHEHILLIDWGAGACVATLLRAHDAATKMTGAPSARTHRIVGVAAEEQAGGLSLDRLIAASLEQQLAPALETAGADARTPRNRVGVLLAAESLKTSLFEDGAALSEASAKATVDGADGSVKLPVSLTLAAFEGLVKGAFEKVETMLRGLLTEGGVAADAPLFVHVSGGTAQCAPAQRVMRRAIGEPRATFVSASTIASEREADDDGAYTAVCGAAVIAAHSLQPAAVEAFQEALPDALSYAVSIAGGDGTVTPLFAKGSSLGQSRQLQFAQTAHEQTVRLIEGDDASGGSVPLLEVALPPLPRRRRALLGGKSDPKAEGPPMRTVTVELRPSGVLDADVDDDGEEDGDGGRPRLGVCGTFLLLMLLLGSVLGVAQQLQSTPQLVATADEGASPGMGEQTDGAGGGGAGGGGAEV